MQPSSFVLIGACAVSCSGEVVNPHLAKARRNLAEVLDKDKTFRDLRLRTGLSRAKLADLAKTTQTYVARVESGTLDPGTDMLARLASALQASDVAVFSAVRAQPAQQE